MNWRRAAKLAWSSRNLRCCVLCFAGLAVNVVLYLPFLHYTPDTDFLGLYPGGRLCGTGHLYDTLHVLAVQREAIGHDNSQRLFIRPPFYAAMLWPLARLSYRHAFEAFQMLMLAAVAAFVWFFPFADRRSAAIACCWSMPLFGSFVFGQDLALLLGLTAVGLMVLKANRPIQAGAIFSLCAIKPHLFLLLPILVLERRMWRFGAGLLAGGSVLIALSFLAAGPKWLPAFWGAATLPETNRGLAAMPNLNGLVNGRLPWEIAGALIVCALVWHVIRRSNLEWSFAAIFAGGVLISHHTYIADCAILLPALLAVREQADGEWQRLLALFLMTPIVFICVYLAGVGLLGRLALVLFALSFLAVPQESRTASSRRINIFKRGINTIM